MVAPLGQGTRPTADRVRQALFDALMHAAWCGRAAIDGAAVLDVFAGTGALGLEALSRGAATACFIEHDAAALNALRANVAACQAQAKVEIVAGDALAVRHRGPRPDLDRAGHDRRQIVFLDPPYGRDLVPRAIAHLSAAGMIEPDALVIAETGRDETWVPEAPLLAERHHGAARVLIFRLGPKAS